MRFSKNSVDKANRLRKIVLKNVGKIKISEEESKEVLFGVLDFLDFHTGRGKDLKSMEFFKSISSGGFK